MRKSGKYGRNGQAAGENITWRTRIACLITKAKDTHLEYVILMAFTLQQWLRESASVLHNTFIGCVVDTSIILCLEQYTVAHCTRKHIKCHKFGTGQ
jgi:hypothetical protein